jgi:DNA polymerase-4
VSNENTFAENLTTQDACMEKLDGLYEELAEDVRAKHSDRRIWKAFVKMKFADFKQTTVERAMDVFDPQLYRVLMAEAWERGQGRDVRLLGAGVRFVPLESGNGDEQLELL